MFLETFNAVKGNFSSIFEVLFEGGEADLHLGEGSDPLEVDIIIRARPKGKRVQDISLLSGGERALTALALLFALWCSAASAQSPRMTLLQWSYGTSFSGGPNLDEPLVTDRPDFTEASSTVGLGVAQLEFGYTYSFDNDGTDQTTGHSIGEPLLRYGILANWFELRIATNYLNDPS